VPLDRETTLKQAERLIRQGKLDGAIAEYVRLVEDQPRDWSAVNALGDLYLRAGDVERAVAQFTKAADHHFDEGYLPKAAALYKKSLKAKKDDDHTLLRLADISARHGLLADARSYLRTLGRFREERGDSRGAAECVIKLGSLDEADADARMAGARAAQSIGDVAVAKALLTDAAGELAAEGRSEDATEALAEAASLDPSDASLRRRLARQYLAAGHRERALEFLTRETAGQDPELLYALGRKELTGGHHADARATFTRLISIARSRSVDLVHLADELTAAGNLDAAFVCIEVLVDDAVLHADWNRGIEALEQFLKHGPHIQALGRLVELAEDGGRTDLQRGGQARLVDAYLDAGRGADARVVAERLVGADPASEAHVERLRRALELDGVADPDAVIARCREPKTAAAAPVAPKETPGEAPGPSGSEDDATIEVDLTEALTGLNAGGPGTKQ
jgi:Flp pilus assembly protein TadD